MTHRYYVIEREYVGPLGNSLQNDYQHTVYGHYFLVQDQPGLTNMSRDPKVEGSLGTTNDWHEYAHGEFASQEEAENWIQQRIAQITQLGFRREEPPRGSELIAMHGDEPVTELVRYYVGDEAWANLVDAGDWLAETSNAELGIGPETTDEELASIKKRLEEVAEADGFRYWNLEDELERRRDEAREGVQAAN